MKKILVVFTGGTICTTIQGGQMTPDAAATAALIELYRRSDSPCKDRVELIAGKSFHFLSENMTVQKWNTLIDYFQQILPTIDQYSGIIVAHGTDTLAYSTALFSQLLKGIGIPVLFVSSNRPLLCADGTPDPRANGADNFRAAVEWIDRGLCPDVYAPYRNPSDGITYLHKGAHLLQCRIYDENFYSSDATEDPILPPNIPTQGTPLIAEMGDRRLSDCILKITPYVGLNYEMLDPICAKAVLHGTYHSGTACVESDEKPNSILFLFERCAERNIPFYYAPAQTGAEATVYASVPLIEKHRANGQKIRFHYGMTEELLYAKLLLAYSMDWPQERIDTFLEKE